LLLKTLAFRSFHSSHVIRVTADFKPSGQFIRNLYQEKGECWGRATRRAEFRS
jgi:hypothetical protein